MKKNKQKNTYKEYEKLFENEFESLINKVSEEDLEVAEVFISLRNILKQFYMLGVSDAYSCVNKSLFGDKK